MYVKEADTFTHMCSTNRERLNQKKKYRKKENRKEWRKRRKETPKNQMKTRSV